MTREPGLGSRDNGLPTSPRTRATMEINETSQALTVTAGNARRLLDDDSTADVDG